MFSSLLKSTPVRRSLTFALSKRTLQTTATIKTNHWRPRWQHENRGQYWGAEWLRRNMVVELENFWHVILFVLWCSYMYRKFFHRQDKEMELSWRKFQGKGQLNEQFEEMDDHAYYPRPIRQSELDDPKNVWHRFKYRIGQFWRFYLFGKYFNMHVLNIFIFIEKYSKNK